MLGGYSLKNGPEKWVLFEWRLQFRFLKWSLILLGGYTRVEFHTCNTYMYGERIKLGSI
jgi:hypothetical protein